MVAILLILYLFLFIFSLFIVLIVTVQLVAIFTTDAPFVPVPKEVENEIVDSLGLQENSVLFDLGCGDARILTKAAVQHPTIKVVGVEIGFLPYLMAKFYTRKNKNIFIKRENIFTADLKEATHIFLYLYPKVINKLFKNIETQCKTGTIIASCDFELNGKQPTKIIELNNPDPHSKRGKKLFIYSV